MNDRIAGVHHVGATLHRTSRFCIRLRIVKFGIRFISVNNNLNISCSKAHSTGDRDDIGCSVRRCIGSSVSALISTDSGGKVPRPGVVARDKHSLATRRSILVFRILRATALPRVSRSFRINRGSRRLMRRLCRV